MSERIIIWLPEDLNDPWAFYSDAEHQGWAATDEERRSIGNLRKGDTVIVGPGTWFRTFPHSLPDMKSNEKLSAAKYAVEEKLAAALEEQHIIIGKGDDQRIGVVSLEKMDEIFTCLDGLNIRPSKILAEFEAFDTTSGPHTSWSRTIHPGPMGYSMDAAYEGDNPLSLMPQMVVENGLNFAQGTYTRRESFLPDLKTLIPVAACVGFAAIAWLFWQLSEGRSLNQQADQLTADARALYTEKTGKAPPPQMEIAIRRLGDSSGVQVVDFENLSARFFKGLKQVEGVYVDNLRFDEKRGSLTLKLVYPDFDTATRLEQIFAGSDARFQSGSVREQNGELIGEGTFSMGGGS